MRAIVAGFLAVALFAIVGQSVAAANGAFFVGSAADVAGVKGSLPKGDGASGVHVDGAYALVQWYDAHVSAPAVYKRVAGEHWKSLLGGGGVMPVDMIEKAGVPATIARQLCSGWPHGYSPCGAPYL